MECQELPLLTPSPSPPFEQTSAAVASTVDHLHDNYQDYHQNHLCLLLGADKKALADLQKHSLFRPFEEEFEDEDFEAVKRIFSHSSSSNSIHHFFRFSQIEANSLVTSSPPITSLKLIVHNLEHFLSSSLYAIVHLITNSRPSLNSFSLQLSFTRELPADYLKPIFNALSGCSRLERLTLEFHCTLKNPAPVDFFLGPLIASADSRIQEVNLYSRDEVLFLRPLFKAVLPTNQTLKRISIGSSKSPTELMRSILLLNYQTSFSSESTSNNLLHFTSRIVKIVTEEDFRAKDINSKQQHLFLPEVHRLVAHFSALNSLELNLLNSTSIDVQRLFDSLLTLKYLTYFKLAINGDCISPPGGDDKPIYYSRHRAASRVSPSSRPSPSSPPSPLKALHLSLAMNSHCDLLDLDLPSRFPHLETFLFEPIVLSFSTSTSGNPTSLRYSSGIICDICGIKDKEEEGTSDPQKGHQIRSCTATLLEHLKVHQRLKVVHFFCKPIHHKVLRIATSQIDQFISEQLN